MYSQLQSKKYTRATLLTKWRNHKEQQYLDLQIKKTNLEIEMLAHKLQVG